MKKTKLESWNRTHRDDFLECFKHILHALEMEKLYVRFSRECIKVILDSAAWFLKEWHIMTYEFGMFSLA
jgi:hypothetical protein